MLTLPPTGFAIQLADTLVTLTAALIAIRLILLVLVPAGVDSRLYALLRKVTDVVVVPVRFITPRAAPEFIVLVFALCWLFLARFLLLAVAAETDLSPALSGAADSAMRVALVVMTGTMGGCS